MSEFRPILFNAEMVKAILEGRKTVTRRCIKTKYSNTHLEMFKNKYGERLVEIQNNVEGETFGTDPDGRHWQKLLALREIERDFPPCRKGDILWVRETWCWCPCWDCGFDSEEEHKCLFKGATKLFCHSKGESGCYGYKASFEDDEYPSADTWHPSIYMPKEAARIFLKVTDVRVERLNDMRTDDFLNEGIDTMPEAYNDQDILYWQLRGLFEKLWNYTIKPSDLDTYGWDANPYVWVIEFERCDKPEDWEADHE